MPQALSAEPAPRVIIGNIVEAVIIGLIGAMLMEQNGEWQTQNRRMQVEAMAGMVPTGAVSVITFPPKAAGPMISTAPTDFPPL